MLEEILYRAFPVSKVEEKTTGLFFQIVNHLVKLFLFEDKYNKQKHINDIEIWIEDCCEYIFKSKSKISLKKLKLWYKYEKLPNYISGYCLKISRKYSVPKIRSCDKVVTKTMKHIDTILKIMELANKNYEDAMRKLEEYIELLEKD